MLVNLFGIRNWDELSTIERSLSGVRYAELEESPIEGGFDLDHLCAIHKLRCIVFSDTENSGPKEK